MAKVKTGFLITALLMSPCISAQAAAPAIPFTVTTSEPVSIASCTGSACPYLSITVGSATRAAYCPSVTNTLTLTCTYTATAGDVDLDGIAFVDTNLHNNGIAITDQSGNTMTNLAFTPPSLAGVKVDYPSVGMDFITDSDGRFSFNGTVYNDVASFISGSGATFSRASTATYFDSSGNIQTAATNTPRIDYHPTTHAARGLMIEEGRTNYVKNSQFSGLTVGTNTTTANWQIAAGPIPGSTVTVTGTGSQNGIPYVDVRFNIPTNGTGSTQWPNFGMPIADAAAVSSGTKSIFSSWFGVTSYTATGGVCTIGLSNRSYTAGNAYITEASNYFTATSPYTYQTTPVMTHGPTAAKAYFFVYVTVLSGVSCDITIRLGGPQFEIGSVATSYIPTPAGNTASRLSDVFTLPTGSWYNASEGTLIANAYNGTNAATVGIASIDNSAASGNDRITLIRIGTTSLEAMSRVSNVAEFQTSMASNGDNALNKFGMGYKANNFRQATNNSLGSLDSAGAVPTVDRLRLGIWGTAAYYDGWIQKLRYYPVRTSDTQLQLLTQ